MATTNTKKRQRRPNQGKEETHASKTNAADSSAEVAEAEIVEGETIEGPEIVIDADDEQEAVVLEAEEVIEGEEVEAEILDDDDEAEIIESNANAEVLVGDDADVVDVSSGSSKSKGSSNLPVKAASKEVSTAQLSLLQQYFKELRKYPLLTPEEEYDMAVEFQENQDPDLAFRLTTANLRLVVKIAMEYQSAVANLLDLIQEGNVGLMQAVKKFDPYRGIRLSSYAQWWIRAYILKYLVNNARLVKIGTTQAQRKLFFNLRKEKEKLESLGFKPSPALLAERLDVRVEDVNEMEQRLSRSDLSLDLPVGDDQKSTIGDLMASGDVDAEDLVIGSDLREQIRYHMDIFAETLKDRERVLWEKRLTADEPMTLQEVGDIFGVTRERARQIEKEMIRRFREYLQRELPDLEAFDFIPGAPD
ncbi:MAG: sigma-70 family RNA polymerase sigma factor [Deltaproteobacteria bacterium]|nr:MAG: sigma-70 family RNA polymerase sigma factor [Deltaproteobacteria bacterium]